MITIVQILAPVVLVIALGWGLARSGFLSTSAFAEINRLTYWVGLPALLIGRIGAATPSFDAVGGLLVVLLGATAAVIVIAVVVGFLWQMPMRSLMTFSHGAFRGNLTFVGLPVVIYAFTGAPGAGSYESAALIAFVPMIVLYNIVAVVMMELPGETSAFVATRRVLTGLVTNPILIATLVGMAIAIFGVSLPVFVDRTLFAVGQMALPLALMGIGAGLYATRLRGRQHWAVGSALLKTAAAPAVGFMLGTWIGLGSEEMRIALIFLACPSAAAAYVLVQQTDGDTALIASTIVLSHLLALPAMVLVLALTA